MNLGDKKVENTLTLKDYPIKNLKSDTAVREQTVELQTFTGHQSFGFEVGRCGIFVSLSNLYHYSIFQDTLKSLTLSRMNSGDASLIVESKGDSAFLIEGRIMGV